MTTLYPCPFDIRICGEGALLSNGSSQDGSNGIGEPNGRPTSTRMTSDSRTLTRSSTAVLSANDDFPIFFEDKHKNVVPVRSDLSSFIALDLDVSRINVIHSSLWACGRPLKARSLHRQKVLGREIVISEQCDLHLLYHSEVIVSKLIQTFKQNPHTHRSTSNRSLHTCSTTSTGPNTLAVGGRMNATYTKTPAASSCPMSG